VTRVETTSPEETEGEGAALARRLRTGDVVLVAGELGSGKTTFVRGACHALGVGQPVTSPTFTIGELYRGAGGLEVAHLDLYRLETLAGEDPALLADYLTAERIGFVEWPGVAAPDLEALAPGARVAAHVRIEHLGERARAIDVVGAP
jgi:tRNA threonylcarbamoyladenosine biosynthesis protein TsaE